MLDGEIEQALVVLRDRLDRRLVAQLEADGGLAAGLLAHVRARRGPALLFAPSDLPGLSGRAARWDPDGHGFDVRVADEAVEWRVIAASHFASERFVSLDRNSFDYTRYDDGDPQAIRGLNRQRWFVSLARAYWQAGDRRYFNALMEHWDFYAAKVPAPDEALFARIHALGPKGIDDANYLVAPYGELDSFIRLGNWWWAYWLSVYAEPMTPERNAVLLARSLQLFDLVAARGVRRHEHNFTVHQMMALHLWSASLPEVAGMTAWKHAARNTLESSLGRAVFDDGVQWEKSGSYQAVALRWYITPYLLGLRNGDLWAPEYGQLLRRMGEFIDAVVTPDGSMSLLSDTDRTDLWATPLALLRCAFPDVKFRRPVAPTHDSVWISGGTEWDPASSVADVPEPVSVFPRGGVGVVRPNPAGLLIVDNGPNDAGHSHQDNLTVHFDALGVPVLVDPGRWIYAGDDPDRHWVLSGYAHNTIVIEDQPVTPGEPSRSPAFATVGPGDPRIGPIQVERDDANQVVRLSTWFGGFASDPAALVQRTVFMPLGAGEPWLVVVDRISARDSHVWTNSWLLPASIPISTRPDGFTATLANDVTLGFTATATEPLTMRDDAMFWSPVYGEKNPARWVRFSARCQSGTRTFVFQPTREGKPIPTAQGYDHIDLAVHGKQITLTMPDFPAHHQFTEVAGR